MPLFLRRYVTWCARSRRYTQMRVTAQLFTDLQRQTGFNTVALELERVVVETTVDLSRSFELTYYDCPSTHRPNGIARPRPR